METLRVGLTGGIGSGKTVIANRFRELGCRVLHADELGHKALTIPHISYFQTVAAFGVDILNEDHTIDRKKLGSIVFSDPDKLELLESFVHPEVRRLVEEIVDQERPQILVYEVAILLRQVWKKSLT